MKPFRRQDRVHSLDGISTPCFECWKSIADEMDPPVVIVLNESQIGRVKVSIKATEATLRDRVEVFEI